MLDLEKSWPKLLDHFEIIQEIGRGGMGIVVEAKDVVTQQLVAIKLLNPNLSMDLAAVTRFHVEINACQALSHRNIIPILEVGQYQNTPYYVMPLIAGTSLSNILKLQRDKISIRLATQIAFQVALALNHAHQHGVIHRDIKPNNIMVTNELVMVTDFGLARPEWMAKLTTTGIILGTPNYMSPEQIQGIPYIDGRSDIYSLGICLYEMLTGMVPFQGETIAQLFHQILHVQPMPPKQINTNIPRKLNDLVLKSLAKHPSFRFQNAEEMAEILRCFLCEPSTNVQRYKYAWLINTFQKISKKTEIFTIRLRKILALQKLQSILIQIVLFFITLFLTYLGCSYLHNLKLEKWHEYHKFNNSPNSLYYALHKAHSSLDIFQKYEKKMNQSTKNNKSVKIKKTEKTD